MQYKCILCRTDSPFAACTDRGVWRGGGGLLRAADKAVQLTLLYQARAPAKQEAWMYCLIADTVPLILHTAVPPASLPLPAALQGD